MVSADFHPLFLNLSTYHFSLTSQPHNKNTTDEILTDTVEALCTEPPALYQKDEA
jgi:hypothetical protein